MSAHSELAAGLIMEADAIRKVLDHGRSQGLYPQYLGNAERGLRKAAEALQELDRTNPLGLDLLTLTGPRGETATMLRSTYDALFARS